MTNTMTIPLLAEGRKKKWSYSSLVFSLFYFVPLFAAPLPDSVALLTILAGYVLFIALYVTSIHQPLQRLPYWVVALLLLATLNSINTHGGAVMFGYIAFIVGYYYRVRTAVLLTALMAAVVITIQMTAYADQVVFATIATANMLVLIGFGMMERKETLHQLREARHAASMGTLSAIAERERIGRDLHDVAGHALSSISLKAQLADKLLEKGRIDEARAEARALAQLSQSLLSEIRQTVSGIKQLSLHEEIEKALAKLRENGFEVSAEVDHDAVSALSVLQETHLALIIKEGVTNVLRHSRGKQVTLTLHAEHGQLLLTITDDGKTYTVQEGNGLSGIRERAALINADIAFDWGQQTRLNISLPMERSVI
ncbi:histidine kinase [Aestuariibacter halophilus]|uniref:Histidine kinase n=1 Tax=Fluctibacter halophilus TaxID=226011 RepID=A0ABS8G6D3_9ALTE|nr:histidine kinase [Aestuariibacter halophilus]MCC2616154.1 histidine kinase [Aestuariibacter halophilus]